MIEHRNSEYWKKKIKEYDDKVSKEIIECKNRVELSEKLLIGLRNCVESIMCFIKEIECSKRNGNRYKEIEEGINYCKKNDKLNFLNGFHKRLNIIGHENFYGEYAERLFLKYVSSLIDIKKMLKENYDLQVFNEIDQFPFDLDDSSKKYYEEIIKTLRKHNLNEILNRKDSYYIHKKKKIYLNNEIFYEYTLSNALDNTSKFDRFIAFSLLNIPSNYAIKANTITSEIEFFEKKIEYEIISSFDIAIRPCEFEKMLRFFGIFDKFQKTKEYFKLMEYLKINNENLSNIIEFEEDKFNYFIEYVFNEKKEGLLYKLLMKLREFIYIDKKVGCNVLKYLLFKMNNIVMQNQFPKNEEESLSTIYLSNYFDYETYGSIEVFKYFEKFNSYHEFLVKYEQDYSIRYNNVEKSYLKLLSKKYIKCKRPFELELLSKLISHNEVDMEYFEKIMKEKYPTIGFTQNTLANLINQFTGKYIVGTEAIQYKTILFGNYDNNKLIIYDTFKNLLESEKFKTEVLKIIEFGLYTYNKSYVNNYQEYAFKLNAKYCYEEVCRLLDWKQNEAWKHV